VNRRKAIGSMVAGAAVAAVTTKTAQAAEKANESMMARWNQAKVFTMLVADAMPADAYDFKPKPEMRGFGELMVHIGQANVFYLSRMAKSGVPDSLKAPKPIDKASAQKYLADTFDFCAATLSPLSVADLDKAYPGRPGTPAMTGWDLVFNVFIHTAHHRGYADVYLREKGITPPTYSV
jgi:uncharacterized damage-inducible protein DinB